LSDDPLPDAIDNVDRKKQEREDLLARLRDVTAHRDELLSQYEAMAFQVDESTKEVDGALLEARANAKRAQDCEVLERQEAVQIGELTRQLKEERSKSDEIATDFARYRDSVEHKLAEHARREDPWSLLAFAISQILCQGVAWLRAKIPPESSFLPWFDRTVDFIEAVGRLAWKWGVALFEWAKPRAVELWTRIRSEISQRAKKE
jgi:hypothetical protein